MGRYDNVIPITAGRRTIRRTGLVVSVTRPRSSLGNEFHVVASLDGIPSDVQEKRTSMTYIFDTDNYARHCEATEAQLPAGSIQFSNRAELGQAAQNVPLSRLVAIWNNLRNVQRISKFENRTIALDRIWRALTQPQPIRTVQHWGASRKVAGKSKTDVMLDLLRRPDGATLKELQKATRWQAHSVRGFISGNISKRLGLAVRSFKRDGIRVYAIATTPANAGQ